MPNWPLEREQPDHGSGISNLGRLRTCRSTFIFGGMDSGNGGSQKGNSETERRESERERKGSQMREQMKEMKKMPPRRRRQDSDAKKSGKTKALDVVGPRSSPGGS